LLTWSSSSIAFATSPEDLRVHDVDEFQQMLAHVTHPRRRVPVPRQVVRAMASPCTRCVIAVMLAHLIRCLFYQFPRQCCMSGGFCKASWIAETFRVDVRNVKTARKFLADELGWLRLVHTPQRLLNRYGQRAVIDLQWSRVVVDTPEVPSTESPPPVWLSTSQTPPPEETNTEPFQDSNHQEPTPCSPHPGVRTDSTAEKPPSLTHLVPQDLSQTDRLLALFADAQQQGIIGGSDSERLTFVAVAERARLVGTTNPCGLFAQLVRRRLWYVLTQEDEDAARRRLREHLYEASRPRRPRAMPRGELSDDARFAAVLQARLRQQGFHGDVVALLTQQRPDWTRERWEQARAEVEERQRQRAQASGLTSTADLAVRMLSFT
jgi:hypothetical protein